ncbi:metallophosphoesterase [Pedobacter gandavensis]|uniref:metallophosphoesterase n=1 Tax=Pedobacter gandavensis TaxID=2679963 RepID=UPI00292DF964|nr:metallophosphoesterase [Pedobacter gandavensis]
MRVFLQKLLSERVIKLANKYTSRPDQKHVHKALTALYTHISKAQGRQGLLLDFHASSRLIIFSDQHKGNRNSGDDFALSEKNYLAALQYYNDEEFLFCSLGDSEEFWKYPVLSVLKHNKATFALEAKFLKRNAFFKIFGNHDLYWDNDPLAAYQLERVYGEKLKVYEGIILRIPVENKTLSVFLTHGHQGDLQSDGNWFSKWFVSNVWAPFQAYLRINPNTPAFDNQLKSTHNEMMYNWTALQTGMALITGHTHQPVFNSLTHLERTYIRLEEARKNGNTEVIQKLEAELIAGKISGDTSPRLAYSKNTYFNTGCCCFNDGDITGIEIENGTIRLIKWKFIPESGAKRIVLEESPLTSLLDSN